MQLEQLIQDQAAASLSHCLLCGYWQRHRAFCSSHTPPTSWSVSVVNLPGSRRQLTSTSLSSGLTMAGVRGGILNSVAPYLMELSESLPLFYSQIKVVQGEKCHAGLEPVADVSQQLLPRSVTMTNKRERSHGDAADSKKNEVFFKSAASPGMKRERMIESASQSAFQISNQIEI